MPTFGRIASILNQLSCKHAYMRRATAGRMWLECIECQHETEGVQVSTPREARSRADLGAMLVVTEPHRLPGRILLGGHT